ncbi:MAG TPA: class I SAM-dependent methyltransferase [Gaiellaceae bacterium]
MARLDRLDARYRAHHGHRGEFVFGADERAGLIAFLVGGPGLRVLDLGCRTGALTQHYTAGNEVVGVDVDHGALEQAVERLGIETVWADVEEGLPFPDDSFDVVVAGELLEHLADPAAAVANVRRVLKPGGRFVGSVPNAFRLKSRLRYAVGRHPETDATHLQLFTPAALLALLGDFDDVDVRFAVGRYVRLQRRLMARAQVFTARKPR